MRTCGECIVCCVYPRINAPELKKASCAHCPNLNLTDAIQADVMQLSSDEPVRCSIYDSRPSVCREYACLWLAGYGEEQDRPDRSGMLIDTVHRIEGAIECKPLRPDGENDPESQATIRRMVAATGKAACVSNFYERRFVRVVVA